MAARAVLPGCVNASNPFHECTETCKRKIGETQPQKSKKNSGSVILDVPLKFERRKKKGGSQPESPRVLGKVPISKGVYPSDAQSPVSHSSAKKNMESWNNEHISSLPHSGVIHKQDPSFVNGQHQSAQSEPTPGNVMPIFTKDAPEDEHFDSPTPTKQEEAIKPYEASHIVPVSNGDDKEESAIDFSFSGIARSYGESDEEVESVISEARVSVGKYHVKESLAPILLSIFNKYGDIAEKCQLESIAIRSYYLECVCLVVQELQSASIMQLTKSKVKELLAILKDVESAHISVAWLRSILNEIAEDIELFTDHRAMEVAKADCDRVMESTMNELESELENLAQKEKEVAVAKAHIAETRSRLSEVELQSSELSKNMLSIKSKVDKLDCKSLLDELL
ncbi:Phospholipase-like protein [Quillaja saponaria]|uniref:Phospholipase-like protein n=1 Tax=Quillaja saponaria TaxID=32244 RepID=A0AAD7QC85_QUISA|nr:Phospholipase-like protein [Quillaja saponaria]KAJ7978636.1 Phospholipase-like protein [Quillaja saponaria]